ncbi:MAG: hypothetical protein A3J46_01375 [Candidatus Yanofskybacteria bacterium RIFCSPHIGHO2_02_FULL_41_11]|uniref:PNPLA domain-containing protein n=1 Tax=Candidatus Yanofskybacteria bacterium RIFCSPHIGHO2_02_FULL_41_11 TaxID=1802675 RepID=A0A1F8FB01_9BACT|nr:MAG: hypothetical protein A3J46_01375 [Candidatus Yanofskybacteria bacterium RIFCSPHIGHO2_02_FULL_41_11]
MEKDKFVLVLRGGANSGIFGCGIGTGIIKLGLYDHIEAVYSVSCGGFNGAYLAARQDSIGYLNYTEELTRNFINLRNIFSLLRRSIYQNKQGDTFGNVIDINYAVKVVREGPFRLDINAVSRCQFPIYLSVWNLDERRVEFIDLRTSVDPFQILKATSCILPYFWSHVSVNGYKYIEPYLNDSFSFDRITRVCKDKKIVVVFNDRFQHFDLLSYVLAALEGFVARRYSPRIRLLDPIRNKRKFNRDLKLCLESENVLVIKPPQDLVSPICTDKLKLLQLYQWGIEAAGQIPEFLERRA